MRELPSVDVLFFAEKDGERLREVIMKNAQTDNSINTMKLPAGGSSESASVVEVLAVPGNRCCYDEVKSTRYRYMLKTTATAVERGHLDCFNRCFWMEVQERQHEGAKKISRDDAIALTLGRLIDGYTLLHTAAIYCRYELVDELLRLGADPHKLAHAGMTSIMLVMMNSESDNDTKFKIIDRFLRAGVSLSAQNEDGLTVVHMALFDSRLLEYMLQRGAPPDVGSPTPLHSVGSCGVRFYGYDVDQNFVAVALLLRYGASANEPSLDVGPPLAKAIHASSDPTVMLLLAHGAVVTDECVRMAIEHSMQPSMGPSRVGTVLGALRDDAPLV